MGKRSRANAKTKSPRWQEVASAPVIEEEKTKPNLRLVDNFAPPRSQKQNSQPRVKDSVALQSIREQQRFETAIASWLPLIFGGMLALGFAYVNSAKNTNSTALRLTSSAKAARAKPAPYVSPLLDSARKLAAKK